MNGPGLTLTVKSIQRCKHYQICETDGDDGRRHYKILSSLPSPYFGSIQELLQVRGQTSLLGLCSAAQYCTFVSFCDCRT